VALGALPALFAWVYYLFALSIDPLESGWYLLLLVTGHAVGLPTALVGCVWLALLAAVVELTRRTPRERPAPAAPSGPPVYGPGRHAGPGSLGGTESALRR
jgi:hypothetical protein